jgi:hypothetical protein
MSASRGLVYVTAVCLYVLVFAAAAKGQRAIPDDNLAYPVLVQRSDGAASGFYLNTAGSIYLVTAKHVLFDPQRGSLRVPQVDLLSYPRNPKEAGRNILAIDLAVLLGAGEVKAHNQEDVVVVRIGTTAEGATGDAAGGRRLTLHPSITVREATASGLLGVAVENVKKYDDVLVGNEVIVFGYPISLGLKELPQLDPLRPLLRAGIVAGQNPTTRSLVIDCAAYPGNSGGPVVELTREAFHVQFKVIGVVREFVPFEEKSVNVPFGYVNRLITNSGYAVATPMDFVLELIK